MIAESLGQDTVTTRKYVKVLPTLQLKSHASIFAMGDIIDWNEQKQAFKGNGHTAAISANILSLLNGSEPRKNYKTGAEMILVTNGKVCFDGFSFRRCAMIDHSYPERWSHVHWRAVGAGVW